MPRRGPAGARAGLTRAGYRLVAVITLLSIGHHIDHILRGMTGWPLKDDFDPFSASLFIYPMIALGLWLSARRRVGARFWAALAGGGMAFLLVVHIGPAAGDAINAIPDQYDSGVAGAVAIIELVGLIAALALHFAYETRRLLRDRSSARRTAVAS